MNLSVICLLTPSRVHSPFLTVNNLSADRPTTLTQVDSTFYTVNLAATRVLSSLLRRFTVFNGEFLYLSLSGPFPSRFTVLNGESLWRCDCFRDRSTVFTVELLAQSPRWQV